MLALVYTLQSKVNLKGVIVTGSALRFPLQAQKAKITLAKVLGTLVPSVILPSGLEAKGISRAASVMEKYVNDPFVHDKASLI